MGVYNYGYSIPYLLFLLYLVVLMFLEFRYLKFGKDIKYIRWAVMASFVYFLGLRGFLYTDWLVYYPLFNELPTIWDGGIVSVWNMDFSDKFVTDVSIGQAGIEMGFIYFSVFFKSIIPDYFAWVFFNTILDIILLDIFLRRYNQYYVFGFIIFFVFGGLMAECNLLRNIKAILIFLISLKYLEERRLIPYMVLNLIGVAFHSSAIVFFPLYFFLHKKSPQWLFWTVFFIGNLIFLLQIQYMEPIMMRLADQIGGLIAVKIKLYFTLDIFDRRMGIGMAYLEQNAMFLLIALLQKKLIINKPRNNLFINAYLIYFICFYFFSEMMVVVDRLSLLFIFSYWILIPEMVSLLDTSLKKITVLIILIPYCFLKMAMINSNVFARYDNLLFGIESFDDRHTKVVNDLENVVNPN